MSQDDDVLSVSLVDVVNFFKRNAKQILFTGLFVAICAGVIAVLLQPIYRSETKVLINSKKFNTLENIAMMPGEGSDTFAVDSEVEVIKSVNLLHTVAQKEGLYQNKDFYKNNPSLMTVLGVWLGVHDETVADAKTTDLGEDNSITQDWLSFIFPAPLPETQELLEHKVQDVLRENLGVRREGRSYIITVSYDSSDAKLATRIVNRVATEYLNNQITQKQDATKDATKWLDERLAGLKKELDAKEAAIAAYKEQHNLYGATGVTQIERQLTSLNEQLVTVRVATEEKRARFQQVESLKRSGSLQSYSGFIDSSIGTNLRSQEAKVLEEVADLSAKYGENHPMLLKAKSKLTNIRLQIANEAERMIANARSEYLISAGRQKALESSLAQLKTKFDATGSHGIRLQKLEREAETAKDAYNAVAENFRKTDNTDKIQESDAQIIATASVPIEPIKPRKTIFVLVGFLVGIILSVSVILLRELLIKGYIRGAQLENDTQIKVLTSVNYIDSKALEINGKKMSIYEYLYHKPMTIFADSIYRIRNAVDYYSKVENVNADTNPQQNKNCVMFSSSISGEGKSTLSLSYAVSCAKSGKKVILIDGDFRRPILTKELAPSLNFGLVEYLSEDKYSIDQLITKPSFDNISFIGSTECQLQKTDLFKEEKFFTLINYLKNNYDIVIIDTPPVSAVIDGIVIAESVDSIVYTVSWGTTPKETVQTSLKIFPNEVKKKICGIVLNKVHFDQAEKYGLYNEYSYNSKYYANEN